jgi:hypothetical protein
MDELEQALTQHGMGDPESIKDIIAEVDTDHVRNSLFRVCSLSETFYLGTESFQR